MIREAHMPANTLTVVGTYIDAGKIRLTSGKVLEWNDLDPQEAPPSIPYGTKTQVTIVHEAPDFLHGERGFIWATYNRDQAEIVHAALQAQQIACELREILMNGCRLFVVQVADADKIEEAIDFVWRDAGGLKLVPDWSYPAGAVNESFLRWLRAEG